jgi:hypothetical protein
MSNILNIVENVDENNKLLKVISINKVVQNQPKFDSYSYKKNHLSSTCFEGIIKLLNTNFQNVSNDMCLKSDVVMSDSIKYNEQTNSLIIDSVGTYLLMYKIKQNNPQVQLGICLNGKLIDIGEDCYNKMDLVDLYLIDIKKEDLIATIQIVNHSVSSINIDEVCITCVKVILLK